MKLDRCSTLIHHLFFVLALAIYTSASAQTIVPGNITSGTLNLSGGQVFETPVSGTKVQLGEGHLPVLVKPGSQFVDLVLSAGPTVPELSGVFSQLVPQGEFIYDPLTSPPQQFPGNIIPVSLIPLTDYMIPVGGNATVGGSAGNPSASVIVDGTAGSV